MKTFIAAVCMFLALLTVIIINCFFVSRTMNTLEQALVALPAHTLAEAPLEELLEYWESRHNELSFSISFNEIKAMDDSILHMQVAAREGDAYEYEMGRALGFDAIRRMRRLERFSWDGIF